MPEFKVPSTETFATWHEDSRPAAVVRALCNRGHDVAEWWMFKDGSVSPWAGAGPEFLQSEGVGGFVAFGDSLESADWVRHPVNPDRPDEIYFRLLISCPRETCNYRKELSDQGMAPIRSLLALLAGSRDQFAETHPSGAPMMDVDLDELARRVAGG